MHFKFISQLTTVNHLQGAFDEARTYARYHPSKGYSWEFKETDTKESEEDGKKAKKAKEKAKEETSSLFQRQRVDILLTDLTRKFPPKVVVPAAAPGNPVTNNQQAQNDAKAATEESVKVEVKMEIKTEPAGNPPAKKIRLGWNAW